MADRGLFINLTCRIDRFVNGKPAGYMDAINLTELTITQPDPDTKVRTSYMVESYGQALGAVSIPKPAEVEFKTDSLPAPVLSMALLGEPAAYSQTVAASGTSGTIELTSDKYDTWIALTRCELTAFDISGKSATTDYDIRLTPGLVKIHSAANGGTIASGTVTYTHTAPARSGTKIVAGTKTAIQISLRGDGINADTGKRCGLIIHKADIHPSGGMNFVGTDYMSTAFKGTIIKPENKAGAWEYWEWDG